MYKETEIQKRKIEKFSRFTKYIIIIIDGTKTINRLKS